jgi:hypothetical protein
MTNRHRIQWCQTFFCRGPHCQTKSLSRATQGCKQIVPTVDHTVQVGQKNWRAGGGGGRRATTHQKLNTKQLHHTKQYQPSVTKSASWSKKPDEQGGGGSAGHIGGLHVARDRRSVGQTPLYFLVVRRANKTNWWAKFGLRAAFWHPCHRLIGGQSLLKVGSAKATY